MIAVTSKVAATTGRGCRTSQPATRSIMWPPLYPGAGPGRERTGRPGRRWAIGTVVPPPTPRVSVLLPARDAGATLPAALASLRRQTLQDWECVVVDDGSHDDTGRIAAAAGDPRITLTQDATCRAGRGADRRARIVPRPLRRPHGRRRRHAARPPGATGRGARGGAGAVGGRRARADLPAPGHQRRAACLRALARRDRLAGRRPSRSVRREPCGASRRCSPAAPSSPPSAIATPVGPRTTTCSCDFSPPATRSASCRGVSSPGATARPA